MLKMSFNFVVLAEMEKEKSKKVQYKIEQLYICLLNSYMCLAHGETAENGTRISRESQSRTRDDLEVRGRVDSLAEAIS